MSTRCLIGAETESGVKMVYVHSNGYPDGQWGKVQTLQRLVSQFGLGGVLSTLLETPSGWSSFDGSPGDELQAGHTDGRFELIPNFGVRYTLTPTSDGTVQGNTSYATPGELATYWDIEYIYIITSDGKLKWSPHSGDDWDALPWTYETL
jgi:hypothetical protein